MSATEFATARFPDAEAPHVQDQAGMRNRVRKFVRPGERARLRAAGGDFGPWREQAELVERLLERVERMGVGPKLIVQRQNDLEQLSIREVFAAPTIPELHANPHIEESHALTYAEFGDLRSGGLWLCRFVDGTKTVSYHGFLTNEWKGSAEDTFVTEGGMTHLEEVARFKVDRAKRGVLNLRTVIVNTSIYTAPDFNERTYGGQPHYHTHEDAPGGTACRP